MSFWRIRCLSSSPSSFSLSLDKHLHSMLSSSNSYSYFCSYSYSYSHPLAKTLPRRSFQTLVSAPPLSSSAAARPISFLSALLFRWPPPHRPFLLLASAHPSPKAFSSASSGQELEWREDHHQLPQEHSRRRSPSAASCSDDDDDDGGYQDHLLEVQQEKQSRFIPVKAYFLCTSIDLRSLQSQNAFNVIPPNSRAANYVVLRYYDVKGDPQVLEAGFGNESNCHYMVVFQYGSVVLFNVSDHEADGYLKIVEKHASGLLPEMRKDDYAVVEKPTLDAWMQGGLDYIMLKNLSIDGIRTIGSVLGQSIALEYYIRQVDGMVAEFTDINRGMEKTGTFTMKRKKLFQLVGKANSNLADVILKLGLFERSDIAWKNANYAQIWEYLRDEYELTQRFGNLDFKLKFVEHNIRFLQEILQNRKSDFLEWLIIILISVEILISVYNIVRESL
ncbi:LOW QUALITY PROTEIN: protein RETARDED ROOT GROWTH, mitochondrial [Elaeis guineensis]|uniref:LOW QUALITY PROTEIN: protein RETARDED ROOT GROWTH, mitochondrial n=1 Tax=Elaeis guineensis var. tenera TaxID=51953 RepID=UPI003C6CD97B